MSNPRQFVRKSWNYRNIPRDDGQFCGAAELGRRFSVAEAFGAVESANLQRATRLRQPILQKAIRGGFFNSKIK